MTSPSIFSKLRTSPERALKGTGNRDLLLMGAVLAIAFLPLTLLFLLNLWQRPHYQFFPLVLAGSAVLFISSVRRCGVRRSASLRWGRVLPAAAWVLLAVGVFFDSVWLGVLATLLMLAGISLSIGGWAFFRQCLPAWGFLWLIIPPPFRLDTRGIAVLQTLTASCSSSVLDLLGVHHLRDGNVIEVATQRFGVQEACSGVHSLLAVLACTLFFVLWVRRRWWHAVLLLAAALVWVFFENVARVVGVVAITSQLGVDLTEGFLHDLFGFALFFNTLFLVWSTDRLLLFLTAVNPLYRAAQSQGERAETDEPSPLPEFRLAELRTTWLASRLFLVAFALVGVFELLLLAGGASASTPYDSTAIGHTLEALGKGDLNEQIGRWKRQSFRAEHRERMHTFGEFSREWTYQLGEGPVGAVVSLDYVFPFWHDLAICYRGSGSSVLDQKDWPAGTSPEHPTLGFTELNLARPHQRKMGLVLFTEFFRDGSPTPRPELDLLLPEGIAGRIQRRLQAFQRMSLTGRAQVQDSGPVFQVQLLWEGHQPLTEAEQKEVRTFFLESARVLRTRSVALLQAGQK